jgi:hypothetical protein
MAKRMDDNTALYVAGGLALIGVILGLRKGYISIGAKQETNDVKSALAQVLTEFGRPYAENIERVLRWETAHFTSKQWKDGNTAGMEATTINFPFGWSSLQEFTLAYQLDPDLFSTYTMVENNTGITKRFIRFPDPGTFVLFLAWFIYTKRNGRFGYWYSLNEASARSYEEKIAGVIPRFVNEIN